MHKYHEITKTQTTTTTTTMSVLTVFIRDLLVDPHQSFEIQVDNAKVPSDDQFLVAYDAAAYSTSCCNERSEDDDEFENGESTCCSPAPASPRHSMHCDFKKQFHSPIRPTIKREARWDNHTHTFEKPLCSPIRCRSPSRGGANTGPNRGTLSSGKQDLGLQMPIRSLPSMPPKLDRLPRMPNLLNERPRDSIISTFDLVERKR
jgi:hypothetical protein